LAEFAPRNGVPDFKRERETKRQNKAPEKANDVMIASRVFEYAGSVYVALQVRARFNSVRRASPATFAKNAHASNTQT
jgi:hypothetical protein